jgi:hypothetical protein
MGRPRGSASPSIFKLRHYRPEPIIAKVSQETLAEMVGTTRSRVSFFMNKFRALLSIGWRSFFQIQDQRRNSAYHKHDRDQQHRRLPGSQLLNVSGQRPLQHNLAAQVRLWVSREGFRRNKAFAGPRLIQSFAARQQAKGARRTDCSAARAGAYALGSNSLSQARFDQVVFARG